jgi:hypothetical protein
LLTQHRTHAVHGVGSHGYLEHGLAWAERLTVHAFTRALSLHPPGTFTLPQPVADDDQAHLRALASLYFTSQLELASLLPAVELLAGIGVGASIDLGPAASKLMEFWRHRSERFSPEERRGLYNELFNSDFENLMISLCEALYKLDEGVIPEGATNPLQEAKVRSLGEELADYLLRHSNAEAAFAAGDILASTRAATEILKDEHVEHAFGAHNVWMTVSSIMRRYGTPAKESTSFVVRGKAGMTILTWLADADVIIKNSTRPLVGLDNPVISAAVDWLQSSLAIEQSNAASPAPEPGPPHASGGA